MSSGYGKTQPIEYVCKTTGRKMYARRANKTMVKSVIKKFVRGWDKATGKPFAGVSEFVSKICKHSSN